MKLELYLNPNDITSEVHVSPIRINDDYKNQWNIHSEDFVCLTKNGKLITNSLYREGGIGGFKLNEPYSLILKYVESYYDDNITTDLNKKRHLAGLWCIVNNQGIEKVVFARHKTPYLTGGIIYSLDRHYYNIETNELICKGSEHMCSEDFVFINNRFDEDKSRRGVWKVNKETGECEIFPTK